MKHVFLLMLLSATSALAATGGGFGGSARSTSPSSVVQSSPAPVVKSPPFTMQTPKTSLQVQPLTSAPGNTFKPLASSSTTPKSPATFPSPQRPKAYASNPAVPQSPDHLSYSTVPTPAYPHEINGRYYPHPHAYYQQHQLLGALLLAGVAEEAPATPAPAAPAHPEGVGQMSGPAQVPASDLTMQLREAFNLQGLDLNELRKFLVGFAWVLIIGGILLSLNSLPLMMRIGNVNGVFLLVLGFLVGLGGVNLLNAVKV